MCTGVRRRVRRRWQRYTLLLENWSVGRLGTEGVIRRTWSLCLEVVVTLSGVPDFTVALGLDVDTEAAEAVVLLPPLERSFSSSSSSSSSRLFTASNRASIQSITLPMVISFPVASLTDSDIAEEGSATPPTDTPCWIMTSRSWQAAP